MKEEGESRKGVIFSFLSLKHFNFFIYVQVLFV
jgi:hypothetical protein